ncbi:TNF receptor-associated factor 2 [Hemiscyllium ocellatum]|uniref:TNF receptor-associated factor 2 n=1 Tax=Hemiscyllium ocellatum TaxID=170820 RepID=UPI002965DEA9|nr:TNF receptor-associated factor 2 [Hemiscyllium ocellatum]XP_060697696.1 TNF receptor-associated factor 2 [Hemiscyllium ocellatum]XP_060697697.1 TNF receptor-associated factor 2 [Hemiscyllium ocellatum]XP_060697698.1 TNF receptor-associated factor 2 [Hemiscyllium ocellatum]XP_060697700.1 TNF receptor-associated factor 2 [Hemiscyllium ocellatum]XP_060697701.1 TNF receptor-associated factor 2 [Hemiscyllium ocellatum]
MAARCERSPPNSLESQAAGNLSGFPKELLATKVEGKYLCFECHGILRKPFQAQCGHRYCASCLKRIVSTGSQKCAACIQEDIYEEPLSVLDASSAFPDNAARREVENLPAVCNNESCTWKGTVKEYEADHEGRCEYTLTPCEACSRMVRQLDMSRHLERECPERNLNCKFCKLLFHHKDIKAHDEICSKFPLTCEWCGKKKIPREKYLDHTRTCGKVKFPCRFNVIGCEITAEKEKLAEHENQCVVDHMQMLLQHVMGIRSAVENLQPLHLQQAKLKVSQLFTSVREMEETLGPFRSIGLGERGSSSPGGDLAKAYLSESLEDVQKRCAALKHKAETFENIVCVLNREVERASVSMVAYEQQHKLDQEKIEALQAKVRQMEHATALKDLSIAELELKLQALEYSTDNGIFIWKISDFSRRRQEAKTQRSPAIFSPAFYTSKYGYKMCLRVYLNGDGVGRGTHMSLFFVIMKGNYDSLLRWPFKQKVTLLLLDQTNREHIIDAFRPDISSSSFQRPVTEMNIASGCPLFCPLSKLDSKNNYSREDCIFIKAIVDLTDL